MQSRSISTSSMKQPLTRSYSQTSQSAGTFTLQAAVATGEVETASGQKSPAHASAVQLERSAPGITSYGRPPPPPRPVSQVITGQPTMSMGTFGRAGFDVTLLDAASRPVYQALTVGHKSGPKLVAKLQESGGQLLNAAQNASQGMKVSPSISHAPSCNCNITKGTQPSRWRGGG